MPAIQLSTNKKYWYKGGLNVDGAATTQPVIQVADPISTNMCVNVEDANLCKIIPFGSMDSGSADNKLFTGMRIYGWSSLDAALWIPSLIAEINVTLGATTECVGVAGQTLDAEDHMADTIVFVDGDESCRIISGITDTIASITVDLEGASRLQVGFTDWTGSADNGNFLYSTF
jgi:hypothetical protein